MRTRHIIISVFGGLVAIGAVMFLWHVRSSASEAASRRVVSEQTVSQDTSTFRILFGGDMMFDRWIREMTAKKGNGFVFEGVRTEILAHDITVANLEGPITNAVSTSIGSEIGSSENYHFTFDPRWAATLATEKIGPVNLGNNHIFNQGTPGISETKRHLSQAGVAFFGDPTSEDRISIRTISGTKIAFVNYNAFAYKGKEKAFADITKARAGADIVILYAHWGLEYLPVQDDTRKLARSFIEAGCDAIIGSHPHIVQETETYRDKTIYYSLGNFIFDQYGDENTKNGLLVSMTVDTTTKNLSFRDIPIVMHTDGSTWIKGLDGRK